MKMRTQAAPEPPRFFQSPTIVLFAPVAATSLIAFLIWEWRQAHPVIGVRMLASRTFASSMGMV